MFPGCTNMYCAAINFTQCHSDFKVEVSLEEWCACACACVCMCMCVRNSVPLRSSALVIAISIKKKFNKIPSTNKMHVLAGWKCWKCKFSIHVLGKLGRRTRTKMLGLIIFEILKGILPLLKCTV